ncbi:MAG: TetR/AcrR family transcriptional regulator [Acidimicrobiales bacterium]
MDEEAEERSRREDPRPAQTRELVLQATRMIIASEGQAAVTPTRLVDVSGVARSTIYRHWPDAAAVIVDAMSMDGPEADFQPSGDPETDLRAYLNQLRQVLESPAATIIVAQADIAERDEQAARTLSGNGTHRNKLIQDLLHDPRSDFDTIHAQLVGPLFMQRFFIRKPITDKLIDAIVTDYLASLPNH